MSKSKSKCCAAFSAVVLGLFAGLCFGRYILLGVSSSRVSCPFYGVLYLMVAFCPAHTCNYSYPTPFCPWSCVVSSPRSSVPPCVFLRWVTSPSIVGLVILTNLLSENFVEIVCSDFEVALGSSTVDAQILK